MNEQVLAFLAAQKPLEEMLQDWTDRAYAMPAGVVPRSIVFAYLAGTKRNMELLAQ